MLRSVKALVAGRELAPFPVPQACVTYFCFVYRRERGKACVRRSEIWKILRRRGSVVFGGARKNLTAKFAKRGREGREEKLLGENGI